jgi:hypothetical protein
MFDASEVTPDIQMDSSEQLAFRKRNRKAATDEAHSIILIRVIYDGHEPDYCDEDCVKDNMWLGETNVAEMYREASYGAIQFEKYGPKGQVITVRVDGGKAVDPPCFPTTSMPCPPKTCKFWTLAAEADAAAREQHNIDPNDFMHQSYYLPREGVGHCQFGGLGFLGCGYGNCKSWLRQEYKTNLAHELGHNLHLWHSASDDNNDGKQEPGDEYGDMSCTMSASPTWRSINGVHRLVHDWVPQHVRCSRFLGTKSLHLFSSLYLSALMIGLVERADVRSNTISPPVTSLLVLFVDSFS